MYSTISENMVTKQQIIKFLLLNNGNKTASEAFKETISLLKFTGNCKNEEMPVSESDVFNTSVGCRIFSSDVGYHQHVGVVLFYRQAPVNTVLHLSRTQAYVKPPKKRTHRHSPSPPNDSFLQFSRTTKFDRRPQIHCSVVVSIRRF